MEKKKSLMIVSGMKQGVTWVGLRGRGLTITFKHITYAEDYSPANDRLYFTLMEA